VQRNYFRAWSLDSSKLYFCGDVLVDNRVEAFMFDLGNPGAGAQRLHPPLPVGHGIDTVAAAGADIALFVGDIEVDGDWNLYAVDTTGGVLGAPVRLNTNPTSGAVDDTRVAPGGRFVAFQGDFTVHGTYDCWIADLREGIPAVDSAVNVSNLGCPSCSVDTDSLYWSPLGDELVFVARAGALNDKATFFVDLRGQTPVPTARISPPYTTFEQTREVRWAPDGSGATIEGEYVTPGSWDLYYVDLSERTPGALVQLSVPTTWNSVAAGDVRWLPDASALVYRHDQDRDGLFELFLATPPTAMAPVKINAPYPADTGLNSIGVIQSNSFFITRDGQRVVARGDVFVDNDFEVFLIDLPTAPSLTVVNGPMAAGGDIDWILLHDYEIR
jgi:Tol biopolymer transport system component